MAKRPVQVFHPLAMTKSIEEFSKDVSMLLMQVHTVIDLIENKNVTKPDLEKAVLPNLQDAMDDVRRHYSGEN